MSSSIRYGAHVYIRHRGQYGKQCLIQRKIRRHVQGIEGSIFLADVLGAEHSLIVCTSDQGQSELFKLKIIFFFVPFSFNNYPLSAL
jgi:hypothetical protein